MAQRPSRTQSKYWLFTWNNPNHPADKDSILQGPFEYVVFQYEEGDKEKTPHYQGYVEFAKNKRLSGCRKVLPNVHWEARESTQSKCITYCIKDEGRLDGPFEAGIKKVSEQGRRTDVEAVVEACKTGDLNHVIEEHPGAYIRMFQGVERLTKHHQQRGRAEREEKQYKETKLRPWQEDLMVVLDPDKPISDRTIHWYWESTGNVGKTWMAKYLRVNRRATILEPGKKADMAYALRDHIGDIIVFNISRSCDQQYMEHLYGFAEGIKDDVVMSTKYQSQSLYLGPQHVVFFSNHPPDDTKWSADRCTPHEIRETIQSPFGPIARPPKLARTDNQTMPAPYTNGAADLSAQAAASTDSSLFANAGIVVPAAPVFTTPIKTASTCDRCGSFPCFCRKPEAKRQKAKGYC